MTIRLDPQALATTGRNIVAFSGGPDSLCLLHLLAESSSCERIRAIHIDHGLDRGSAKRADAAAALAHGIGIECRVERVEVRPDEVPGGPEAAARRVRYERLQAGLGPDDHVLTGHHADDQIETLLLRLLRGAGPSGLSGMRVLRRLGSGWLGRPLLHCHRSEIEAYLADHGLEPVRDPTNEECSPDRNFLRHRIVPQLGERWPGYRESLERARGWQAAAASALDREATANWRAAACRLPSGEVVLDADRWLTLPTHASLAVIRHWCDLAGIDPVPSNRVLAFRTQCREAAVDRRPAADWNHAQLRRYRGLLWLDPKPLPPTDWSVEWSPGEETVRLPSGGRLAWTGPLPDGDSPRWRLEPPPAGARLRVHAGRPRRRIAELLRESGIPPWRRTGLPALLIGNDLVAAGPDWIDAGLADRMAASGARLVWYERPATLLPSR